MKKITLILLAVLALIIIGYWFAPAKVTIEPLSDNYSYTDANQNATVNFKIKSSKIIYFGSPTCDNPVRAYKLNDQGVWEKEKESDFAACIGLDAGNLPAYRLWLINITKINKLFSAGTYKAELTYYLSATDYKQKTNPQYIFSNQFTVQKIGSNEISVIEQCQKESQRQTGPIECIYLAAKNIVTKDLNLALNLCKKLNEMKAGFDGCYDGVALVAGQKGLPNKIDMICNQHSDPAKAERCINMAKK